MSGRQAYTGPGNEPKARDLEDEEALGGMRNPQKAVSSLQGSTELGRTMRGLLETGISQCPSLEDTARDILEGKEV